MRAGAALGFALAATQAATLLWRRRFPFLASVACGLLTCAYGVSTLPDPAVPYAGLVAVYSAAALLMVIVFAGSWRAGSRRSSRSASGWC